MPPSGLLVVTVLGVLTASVALVNTIATFLTNRNLGGHLGQQDGKLQEIHVMVNERLDGALKLIRGLQSDMQEINHATSQIASLEGVDLPTALDTLAAIQQTSQAVPRDGRYWADSGGVISAQREHAHGDHRVGLLMPIWRAI
jgi:hypothetical protein